MVLKLVCIHNDSGNNEVARVLRELADSLELTGYGYDGAMKLMDCNGNTVGKAEVR
jgi:hypothetical protein